MLKNTLSSVTEYTEIMKQAKSVYNQTIAQIEKNYIKDGALYNSAMKTAVDVYNNTINSIPSECKKKIEADFLEVSKMMNQIITVPPTPELLTMIPLMKNGVLSEFEMNAIYDQHKGNYLNEKLMCEAMGKPFKPIEHHIQNIQHLENKLNLYFDGKLNSYDKAILEKGDWIKQIDSLTDELKSNYLGNE